MRVNLQYSIELESIFEELRSLHLRKNIHTVEIVRKNIQDLDSSLIDSNASTSRATIQDLRKLLFNLDSTLSDIDSMLEGYERIQAQQTLSNYMEETNEQLGETNESRESGNELQPD
jgi:paraquat-inducible protein B